MCPVKASSLVEFQKTKQGRLPSNEGTFEGDIDEGIIVPTQSSIGENNTRTQNVWREARVCRKCNAGLTRSGSMTQSTVYNSMKSYVLIARANSHNFLCKIGDGENVVTELTRQHLDRTTTPRASES